MAYIGKTPITGNFVKLDAISVVNGQASYTMNNGGSAFTDYENVNQFLVSLNGILQAPTDSFTVSGSTLTFASNLATGDVIDFVIVLGNTLDIGTPSDATVTQAKTNFVSTSSSAGLQIKGDGTTDGTLQLNCSQNSHGIKLKSPAHSASASYTLTFPTTDGNADEFLKTDGSGVLSWGTAGGANTPAFFAYRSGSNQSISNGVYTKVQCQTEVYDTDNAYDNSSNYRFTPQTAGKYYFFAQTRFATNSDFDGVVIAIYKNGSAFYDMTYRNEYFEGVSVYGIADMNGSSDYLEFYVEQASGSTQEISGSDATRHLTKFGAFKIIT